MRKYFFILSLFTGILANGQDFKDTIFTERGFTCSCKYNFNIEDDIRIVDLDEQPAYYPGGDEAWKKFVKKNMEKGLKGKHTVELRFQVDKNGDLSSFQLLNRAVAQKYEEVVRLVKSSGKWFPSIQKGFCVKSFVRLSFEL